MEGDLLVHLRRELLKLPDAQQRHLDVHVGGELMTKPSGTSGGRPQPDHVFFLQYDDVGESASGEVVGNAQPDDPTPDDHDFGCLLHLYFGR